MNRSLRVKALNLPALKHRKFRADMIETHNIPHGLMDFEDNCVKHLFEMKSTNTRDHNMPSKSDIRTPLSEEIILHSM